VGGFATHYGAQYEGQTLGCGGFYRSADPSIIAVGPAREGDWPCGQPLRVCGAAGCLTGTRQDGCPGCTAYVIDLSEAGLAAVCGVATGSCPVTIEVVPAEAFAPPALPSPPTPLP